jgi:phenylpyruvate tautomerase PptA (4-oxalocrotonate tautomerase family)
MATSALFSCYSAGTQRREIIMRGVDRTLEHPPITLGEWKVKQAQHLIDVQNAVLAEAHNAEVAASASVWEVYSDDGQTFQAGPFATGELADEWVADNDAALQDRGVNDAEVLEIRRPATSAHTIETLDDDEPIMPAVEADIVAAHALHSVHVRQRVATRVTEALSDLLVLDPEDVTLVIVGVIWRDYLSRRFGV